MIVLYVCRFVKSVFFLSFDGEEEFELESESEETGEEEEEEDDDDDDEVLRGRGWNDPTGWLRMLRSLLRDAI